MGNPFLRQTKEERMEKYKKIRDAGFPVRMARRVRDWTNSHVKIFLESNNSEDKHYDL